MRTTKLYPTSCTVALGLLVATACEPAERAGAPVIPTPDLAANGPLRGTMLISAGFDDFFGEIYTMQPDGSELTQLTNVPGVTDDAPKWSPDGRRIVFHSSRSGTADLYLMNADGSGVVQLTSGPEQDAFPAWSPNGQQIAFGRDEPDPGFRPNVYVINVDGTGLTQLTNDVPAERSPIWSPNGQRILYAKGGGRPDIWVMNADGTGQAPLLATPRVEFATDWAPNGRILLAQRVDAATANFEIFVMNSDGTGLTQLTDRLGVDQNALWSWDMRRIVFAYTDPEDPPGITDIWVMNPDGSGLTALTDTQDQWEWNSAWRPF